MAGWVSVEEFLLRGLELVFVKDSAVVQLSEFTQL